MAILPAAKACGNSFSRKASSSATLIFAFVIRPALPSPRAASYITMSTPLLTDICMTAQPARAPLEEAVLLRDRVGSVAVLTLNRPAARNSLSEALIAGLQGALHELSDDA